MSRLARTLAGGAGVLGLAWACAAAGAPAYGDGDGDALLGRQLYREGLSAAGQPVQARRPDGSTLSGAEAACVTCHRPSGLGGTEGVTQVPPITARYLMSTGRPPPGERPRTAPGVRREEQRIHRRTAYDLRSLQRALASGLGSDDQPLSPLMPRYALDERQVRDLVAYLAQLDRFPTDGVSGDVLHLGTVVAGDVPAAERASFEQTLRRCLEVGSPPGTPLEPRRPASSGPPADPPHPSAFPTRWQLHVWTLEGDPSSWLSQLAAHAARQPVFALVSGYSPWTWRPVQAFCEARQLPCVLPMTAAVDADAPSDWTFHFHRGVSLEAALADEFLREQRARRPTGSPGTARVLQWVDAREASRLGAAALERLSAHGEFSVETWVWPRDAGIARQGVASLQPGDAQVAWLSAAALTDLAAQSNPAPGVLTLASTELAGPAAGFNALEGWSDGLRWLHAFDEPRRAMARQAHNVRAWLRPEDAADPRRIRQTGHAVTACAVTARALRLLAREWPAPPVRLLEHLEASEEAATATAFPRFTLGPGQRVGSRGGWLLQQGPAPGVLVPVGDWRVPDGPFIADAKPDPRPVR